MNASDLQKAERYISRDLDLLHPQVKQQFKELAIDLQNENLREATQTCFRVFEGWRSPIRQRYLFAQEPKVSMADAWESAHQYGFAVDFVAWTSIGGTMQWSWHDTEDWEFLKRRAELFGLSVPITWDRGHVIHPAWDDIKHAIRNAAER